MQTFLFLSHLALVFSLLSSSLEHFDTVFTALALLYSLHENVAPPPPGYHSPLQSSLFACLCACVAYMILD